MKTGDVSHPTPCGESARKIQSWWCLRKDGISFTEIEWKPASYDDPTHVIAEAVADVTRNVRAVLERLKVQIAIADAESDF